jgi:hypothetical protein
MDLSGPGKEHVRLPVASYSVQTRELKSHTIVLPVVLCDKVADVSGKNFLAEK